MAERKLFSGGSEESGEDAPEGAPLGGSRAEAIQRLQVGLFGLASMILVVGIATAISNRAQVVEARAVPDAAPTTEPTEAAPQSDPLADAGVVPEAPPENEEEEADEPLGEQGDQPIAVPDIDPTPSPTGRQGGRAPSQ